MRNIIIRAVNGGEDKFVEGNFTHIALAYYRTDANTSVEPWELQDEETLEDIQKLRHHLYNHLGGEGVSPLYRYSAMQRHEMVDDNDPFHPIGASWLQALAIFGLNL